MSVKHFTLLACLTFILLFQSYQSQMALTPFYAQAKRQAPQYRYLTGQHHQHQKLIRQAINDLMLKHLFTPSGIHYSSIMKWLPKSSQFQYFFLLISCLFLYFTQYESLKRIGLLRFLNQHGLNSQISYPAMMILYAMFFLSSQNLLSYLLSGIFLCIIIYGNGTIQKTFLIILFSLIIQMSFNQAVTPIAPVINLFITTIYSLYFPFHLLACGLDYLKITSLPLNFINVITDQLILSMHTVNLYFPNLMITPWTLFLLMALYLRKHLAIIVLSFGLSHMTQIDREKQFWKNKRLKIKTPPSGGVVKSKFS